MADVEIGIGKSARRAYGLGDVSIVPSRRTRDPECVDLSWEIDAFHFDLPLLAVDVSPADAVSVGRAGGLAVLELTGDPDVIGERVREVRDAGLVACGAVTPQRTEALAPVALAAELDLLVIRGTVVSAEHVSRTATPLNLKRFIRELPIPVIVGGCTSYQAALHLMRTGAAGVLVGIDAGAALGIGVPMATAIADARGARMRHLDETGVYCQVIADGGIARPAEVAKAVALGADAVALGAGAPIEDVAAALRKSMATTGYETVKEFQKAELVMTGFGTALP